MGKSKLYLSVPYKNDWSKIKFVDSVPSSHGYEQCISVDKSNLKGINALVDMIVEIRCIFTCPCYSLADGSNDYYSIVVNYDSNVKNVHAIPCKQKTFNKQEKSYLNNYFKNKEEADMVVEKIKKIIGKKIN